MTQSSPLDVERFPLRAPALSDKGMLVAPHYLASLAGADVLRGGGNALDAAIAANAVMAVVWPHMCGMGGDLFLLVKRSGARPEALSGCGSSAVGATIESYGDRGVTVMPRTGPLTVTVPGAVDGWLTGLERWGTRSLDQLLQPAIEYARDGFPVTARLARSIQITTELARNEAAASVFLPGGKPLKTGQRLIQSDMAWSLGEVARLGRAAMYGGELGQRVIAGLQALNSPMEAEDFARHRSQPMEPISREYRGTTIHELPPPTQGLTVLQELAMVEPSDLSSLGLNTLESVDLMVRARNLAFEDRDRFIADPTFADVPTERLLSADYLSERSSRLGGYATPASSVHRGALGDTIYLCAVDRDGMAVSLIQSLYYGFGSRVMAPGTGLMLHNRGASFRLEPGHPNRLEGGKRPMHTLIPALATRGGESAFVFGTRGADGQPQTQFQVISNIVDHGFNPQEAVEAPRWCMGGTTPETPADILHLEARFAQAVFSGLEERGF
ncbi:MAG TPA: gamma-glutamyltransferase, partial [Chloroflexota bacterium]|nr:gamma-glutamyltransferase [Chloroflexota bacterium]